MFTQHLVGHLLGVPAHRSERFIAMRETVFDRTLKGEAEACYALRAETFESHNAAKRQRQASLRFPSRSEIFDSFQSPPLPGKAALVNTYAIVGVTALPNPGTRTITLATTDVKNGRVVFVKDETGLASALRTITVTGQGGETIDGAPNKVIIVPYGVLRLYSDGANWFVL